MKKFKYILISSIIIFLINFPAHFVFDYFPNNITSVFFPTNESIFQHMKMVFTCFFIFYLILYFMQRRLKYNNIFIHNIISSLTCIVFFLIIYIPLYLRFGENMLVTLILLFISILFGQFITSLINCKKDDFLNMIGLLTIFIIFIVDGFLTFKPMNNFLFWDPEHETYERVFK